MDTKHEVSSSFNSTENLTTRSGQGYGNSQSGTNYTAIAQLISIATVIVIINSIVFYLFLKKKTLRTTPNYLLLSLAICDFFSGSTVIPLFTIVIFTSLIQSQSTRFYLGFLVTILHNFVALTSVYHIVIITAERYLAIIFPIKHRVLDQKIVSSVLALVWFFSLLISCIPFAWISKIYPVLQPVSLELTLGFTIFCMIFVLVLPYIFMVYAFIDMFKCVYGKSSNGHWQKDAFFRHTQRSRRRSAGERKCLVLFVIMASVFLICWLPWFVMFLLHQLPAVDNSELTVPSHVSLLIRYMTSVVNPLLYTFLKRDFNHAVKSVFIRHRQVSSSLTCPRRGSLQPHSRGSVQSHSTHVSAVPPQDSNSQPTSPAAVLSTIEECQEYLYESAL